MYVPLSLDAAAARVTTVRAGRLPTLLHASRRWKAYVIQVSAEAIRTIVNRHYFCLGPQ